MADLLSTTRSAIEERLRELRPLVAEAERLERALGALSGLDAGPAAEPGVRAQPRAPGPAGSGRRRGAPRGRRGGSTRAKQFLEIVRRSPGISIAGAAEQMGTAPNYLYRIANGLQQQGALERRGRGFAATSASDVRDGPASAEPGTAGGGPSGEEQSAPDVPEIAGGGAIDASPPDAGDPPADASDPPPADAPPADGPEAEPPEARQAEPNDGEPPDYLRGKLG